MIDKFAIAALALGFLSLPSSAADVRAAQAKAIEFGKQSPSLVSHDHVSPFWADDDLQFAYRVNTGPHKDQFIRVDLTSGEKSPAFDHGQLAAALSQAAGPEIDRDQLPIERLQIASDRESVRFRAFGKFWCYRITNQSLAPEELPPKPAELLPPEAADLGKRRKNAGAPTTITIENGTTGEIEIFWVAPDGNRKSYGKLAVDQSVTQQTYAGHVWLTRDSNGGDIATLVATDYPTAGKITQRIHFRPRAPENTSPDGKWRAVIINHNVVVEPTGSGGSITLSTEGTRSDGYIPRIVWSPDSTKLVAFREKKVVPRQINIVQSSPPDQLQPKLLTIDYPKPGDPISQPMPHLFDVGNRREIAIDDTLFNNPWAITDLAWTGDSSECSFVYNQRGHQVLRIVGIRGDSGSTRTIFEDTSKTFIDYSQKFYFHRVPATHEILWMSERDGINRLYLIDGISGQIRSSVIQEDWIVREVVSVDDGKRQLLLKVVGIAGQDPYHQHFVRVNFDGSGLTRLTTADGNHQLQFSPGGKYYLDTWSRIDQPPVVEFHRSNDGKLISELERADDSALMKTGWSRPERFTAKGRDGKTDIHGIIIRPTHFDPKKKYPVVEDIYAGPHDQFVPKSYIKWSGMNQLAELGFIVVKIDGMGTNWRTRAFHDVCWKNLSDAGFPDRIPWIKAAASSRPWMDLSRVGIYGGSAGGQNALAGLLFHGDFYKVGVADCGCHDNRMDKIWWNEAWMGWPVDESYEKNSNVTHAGNLTGKLMLIVGEVDHNVDPASTLQVINALEMADKDFEFVPVTNSDHGAAESAYGNRRRAEFLVRNLIND